MTNTNFGGWAIEEETFNWIRNNLKDGSTILELGSGNGTIELAKYYNVISIEHNEKYLNLCKNNTYIYAPLVDDFYDIQILKKNLPKNYDLLLIDGPPGQKGARLNFLKYLELFNLNVIIIIDDINREPELKLINELSKHLNKSYTEYQYKKKSIGIII